MRPVAIGRALGIGVRVAGRLASERLSTATQPSAQPASVPQSIAATRVTGQRSGSITRAVGGFFQPFRRAGSIVLLQVSGVFFLLPVLVFAPTLWRTRMSYAHGPDHRTFLAAAVVVTVFLYLGLSSFWRARKR
jgi:hypothetical protein